MPDAVRMWGVWDAYWKRWRLFTDADGELVHYQTDVAKQSGFVVIPGTFTPDEENNNESDS